MKRNIVCVVRRTLTLLLTAGLIVNSFPMSGKTVQAATSGTATYDFNGTDFDTTLKYTGSVPQTSGATLVTDTSTVPSGFTDSVYAGGDASYAATAVAFSSPIDLSKVTSVKVRIYVPTYTYSSSPELRVIDTSEDTGVGYRAVTFPTFDQWCEIELLDVLNSSSITKNADGYLERFVIGYRTRAAVTVYFDSIIIEYSDENYFVTEDTGTTDLPEVDSWTNISVTEALGTAPVRLTGNIGSSFTTLDRTEFKYTGAFLPGIDSTAAQIYIGTGDTGWGSNGFLFQINRGDNTFSMSDYTSGTPVVMENKIDGEESVSLNSVYSDYTDTTPTDFKIRIQFENGDVYALVYVENKLAGMYCSVGSASTFGTRIFGYSNGDGGSYYVEDTEANSYQDVTINRLSSASGVSGGTWGIYPVPTSPESVPGTPWETKFLSVLYEVDGTSYTTDFVRANDNEGLYMMISGTVLEPGASGATITIKKGQYNADDGSDGINITEDFVFYVINGSLTTEFDFDNPDFTSAVYCNADVAFYTVVDADTVTIDGITYSKGDTYSTVGTHTLTYTMYDREYSRKLVIYRYGDLDDNGSVNVIDLVRAKKYLDENTNLELSDSAVKGVDMSCDEVIDENDAKLLRQYLVLGQGVLILSPENGVSAAMPSDAVADLLTDYTEGKSASIKTGADIYHRTAVHINWLSKEDVTEYQVLLAMKSDFSDAVTYTTTTPSLSLINLLPNTTYYWKVVAGDYQSEVRSFMTADTVRTITVEGVSNTRDCGGYATADGKTVKYGMIYRGGKLNDITETGLYQMLTVLGVKTDLDTRISGEGGAGSSSPLGDTVNYLNYSAPYYWDNLISESYKEALVSEIKAFANEDNYPIYVHCSLGRDRTGTIVLLINGLLGVSKEDLCVDYELSFLSAVGSSDSADVTHMMQEFNNMYDGIQSYAADGTFADACEAFMLEYCGITQEEIDTIRQLLLE